MENNTKVLSSYEADFIWFFRNFGGFVQYWLGKKINLMNWQLPEQTPEYIFTAVV